MSPPPTSREIQQVSQDPKFGTPATAPRVIRGMLLRCIFVLVLLLSVLVAGFRVNRSATKLFQDDATLVDLAGRQRALVQRAGLLTERLVNSNDPADPIRQQLAELIRELSDDYESIRHPERKDGVWALTHDATLIFTAKPYRLDARFDELIPLLGEVEGTPAAELAPDNEAAVRIRQIIDAGQMLRAQEALVANLKQEIADAHSRLMITQSVVLGCGILTLLGTGLFVFKPMIGRVRQETQKLEDANQLYVVEQEGLADALRKLEQEREDRRGRVRAMASIMEDLKAEKGALQNEIQNRQQIQEALEASERRFYAIVESAPTAMLMIDFIGEIVLANAETEKLFGYTRDELLSQSVELLVPGRFRNAHPDHRKRFFSQPEARRMGAGRDLFGLRKNGSEFPIEIGLNPIEMNDGVYVLSAIVDITERKRTETEIKRINSELKQKNDEMQQFVYTVSHDLKSPLVTCKGFVGLLREDAAAGRTGEMLDSVQRIERATNRMSEMIEDLLQLSRIGTIRNDPEEIDISMMLANLIQDMSGQIDQVGATILVEDEMPTVHADRIRLTEVFENLLSNALKYGCQADDPQIRIGAVSSQYEWRYFVRDNGQGIPEEYHKKVFLLFQTLQPERTGTGVGLAAVSRIMQIHGGRAWVESDTGEGATFWIAFPKHE